jgi:DNA-binding NtrC family response regulator
MKNKQILVVESDSGCRTTIAEHLETCCFDVTEAASIVKATSISRSMLFDAVIINRKTSGSHITDLVLSFIPFPTPIFAITDDIDWEYWKTKMGQHNVSAIITPINLKAIENSIIAALEIDSPGYIKVSTRP